MMACSPSGHQWTGNSTQIPDDQPCHCGRRKWGDLFADTKRIEALEAALRDALDEWQKAIPQSDAYAITGMIVKQMRLRQVLYGPTKETL